MTVVSNRRVNDDKCATPRQVGFTVAGIFPGANRAISTGYLHVTCASRYTGPAR